MHNILVRCFNVKIFCPSILSEITVKFDLRNNNLLELSRGMFTLTPYLTHLNLQRCNIVKVKEGAFRALGRVVSLNLAYNKIDILYQVTEKTAVIYFPFGKPFLRYAFICLTLLGT